MDVQNVTGKGGHLNATEKFYMNLFGRSKKNNQISDKSTLISF